ncbi:DUF2147 domain-containing protein [Marimonas lutisalis]|uniref:DUF2147 domain-containing protein n=1 Tax=Marimonas lutisalis TaxID=2545756 RepID=UPI001375D1DD|nr:DUF2147 domain-containing protein [Marimonas lutisalis]
MVFGFLATAAAAEAEPLAGVWVTGPDRKGQIGHVAFAPCGGQICGTVLRAYDQKGRPVVTPNVGKRVIWDVTESAAGQYAGRMYVSQLGKTVDGVFLVQGARLKIRGCLGPVCQSQTWSRIN